MKIKVWQKRHEKNLTLQRLSEISGIPKSTISDIENENVEVKLYQLERIAMALKCRISDLFDSDYN